MEMRKRSLKNSLFLLIGTTIIISISACSSTPANPTIQPASAANPVALAVEVATEPSEEVQSAPQVSPKTNPEDTSNAPSANPQVVLEQPAPAVEAAPANTDTQAKPVTDPAAQNNDASLSALLSTPPAAAPAQSESVPAVQSQPEIETKPEVGFLAPDFALQTMDGQTVRLSELRGQPVVISYWATWCGPCKLELPILQSLAQQYAQTGIQILTVNAIEQDKVDAVQGLVSQMGLTMPVLLDQQNQFQSAYKQLFFPTSYFIDSNGIVRFIKLGDASEAELRGNVEKLINNQL